MRRISILRHVDATQLFHKAGIESDWLVGRRQFARDEHVRGFAAAPFQNVLGAQLQTRQHELRIDAAFEAIARVRDDGLFAARARDTRRIEPGGSR